MAAMLQFVVVDDRDEWMQLRRTDVSGIVVDAMYLQYFLHFEGKGTNKRAKKQIKSAKSVKSVDISVNRLGYV